MNKVEVRTEDGREARFSCPGEDRWIGCAGEAVVIYAFQARKRVGERTDQLG